MAAAAPPAMRSPDPETRAARPGDWIAALRAYLLATAFLDLLWEAAHLPLYTIWTDGTIRGNAVAVLHCTMGDVLTALAALTAAGVVAGHPGWPIRRWTPVAALTLALGVAYTVYSEHLMSMFGGAGP